MNKLNIMLMNNAKIEKFTLLHFLHTIVGGFGMNSSSIKIFKLLYFRCDTYIITLIPETIMSAIRPDGQVIFPVSML